MKTITIDLQEVYRFALKSAAGLVLYSQRDPRWADYEYAPGATLGRFGCLITSIAMLIGIRPDDVAEALAEAGAFEGAYLSHPSKIPVAFPELRWGGVVHWRDRPADVEFLDYYIRRYGPTIIEVAFNPLSPKPILQNQHFVVAEEVIVAGTVRDVTICDPWVGERMLLTESPYAAPAGWSPTRAIYGARLVTRK